MKKLFIIIVIIIFAGVGIFFGFHTQKMPSSILRSTSPASSPQPSPVPNQPVRISIPAIGVQASIESVGLDSQNRMDVPKKAADVGWYNLGSKPGEKGSAVIDGHLDTPTGAPAVFWNLDKLTPQDVITIQDTNGQKYSYQVTAVESYPYNQVPLQKIFADNSATFLNLITCSGTWDRGEHNYSERTVVYSVLND